MHYEEKCYIMKCIEQQIFTSELRKNMKLYKIKSGIILLLAVAFLMTGCGSLASEYQSYVKGSFDVIYTGEFDDYEQTTGATKEESEEQYQLSVDNYLANYTKKFALGELNENQKQQLEKIIKDVLAQVKFEVMPAQKENGSYHVEVKVCPLEYTDQVVNEVSKLKDEMKQKQANGEINSEEAYLEAYQNGVIQIMMDQVEKVTYGEEEIFSIPIHVSENSYYAEHDDLLEVSDYMIKGTI